jgi:hypothetical protein
MLIVTSEKSPSGNHFLCSPDVRGCSALASSSKDDIEAYRTGKHIFVEETTAKARVWRASLHQSAAEL